MQCGPTRHTAARPTQAPQILEAIPRYLPEQITHPADAGIQALFNHVANDRRRTAAIAGVIADA